MVGEHFKTSIPTRNGTPAPSPGPIDSSNEPPAAHEAVAQLWLPSQSSGTAGSYGTRVVRAKASSAVAVKSRAGSTLGQAATSSRKIDAVVLNGAKRSAPSTGQARAPSGTPRSTKLSAPFGPLTTAPLRTLPRPVNEPDRLATWCWGQCGKSLPSPIISDAPQPFAPRAKLR